MVVRLASDNRRGAAPRGLTVFNHERLGPCGRKKKTPIAACAFRIPYEILISRQHPAQGTRRTLTIDVSEGQSTMNSEKAVILREQSRRSLIRALIAVANSKTHEEAVTIAQRQLIKAGQTWYVADVTRNIEQKY
jgi:hypothetical protein